MAPVRVIAAPLILGALLALCIQGLLSAAAQGTGDASASEVRRIASKLQCPICEGTSVADSRAAIAQDMRRVIGEKLTSGETETQILQYFVDRYGVGVLRDPPMTGFYSALWWVPVGALVLGAGAVYGMTRKQKG